MAKRGKKKQVPAVDTAERAAPCRLREAPGSTDFEASPGAKVALFTHDHVGAVLIAKAEYAGQQLVPAGQAVSNLELTVLPNRNTLKMVFVFSASTSGRGELREKCGEGSQFLRALAGDEPLQLMRIIGR